MSNGDKNFEEYLEGKSTVSEKYAELGDVDPPAELDAVILAEAERAAKTHSHSAGKRSWVIPVSVAATVMICFSLVLNVLREVPSGTDADQAIDALIPADSFDEETSEQALASKARRTAPRAAENLAMQDSSGRQSEAVPAVLGQSLSESAGESAARDNRQLAKEESMPATAGRVAPLAAAPPGEVLYERAEAPVTQDMDDGLLMEADEHMVLAQMLEVVEVYLQAEATEPKELRDEMESPVDADSLVEREPDKNMLMDSAGFSAEKKSDLPAPQKSQAEEPDARLRRIVELYAQSENIAAAEALDEFRLAFPDHAVSRLLFERGY